MSTRDLCNIPVAKYAADDAILLLWTTWPFIEDALRVTQAWGFTYVTGLPWVKATSLEKSTVESQPEYWPGEDGVPIMKPIYGVGYWMRGCSEVILISKRPKASAVRTNYVGLVSENFSHSRKPDSLYEIAEKFPAPRMELFARRDRFGWHQLGNELPGDGRDIREVLK